MKRLLLLFIPTLLIGQTLTPTWTNVNPSGYALKANGDSYKLLWDSVNSELLYLGHPFAITSIYSSVIIAYNASSMVWTARVDNGALTEDCAQTGAPFNTYNPLTGHQQGYFWYDTTHGQAQMTTALCMSQFMGFTNFYNSSTMTMGTRAPVAPFGVGDGTFNANMTNYQSIDWIANYGKAIFCCFSGGGTTPRLLEFDGVGTYTDITGSVTGTLPPMPFTASTNMSDGTNLWILGGCEGNTPGNFSPNTCTVVNQNDLYKYVPTTKVMSKMSPVGGIKPPITNGSYPFAYYDSHRASIVWYADTNDLWIYNIAANQWTEYLTTGGFVIPTSGSIGPNGNQAQYDPVHDIGVFMYPVSGTGDEPLIYQLTFGAIAPTFTNSANRGISKDGRIRK